MDTSERVKMAAGEWYTCLDPELEALRIVARDAVFEHNSLPPRRRGDMGWALKSLLGAAGEGARIEAPFHCAYGFNIFIGDGVFLNAGCTILDSGRVSIGDRSMFGPQNSTLVMRKETADRAGPDLPRTLEQIQQLLTDENMQELNARVDLDGQQPGAVAKAYLTENGLLADG